MLKKIDRISTRVAKIQPHPLTQVLTQVCAKACWKRKFAAEEKQLFRWLYLEGEQPEAYQSDILTQEVISVIVDEFGYAEDAARRFHQDMIYFTYGLAILANTDHLHLTETELREAFRREFRALISIYGKPAKLPEFAVKAGVVL